MDPQILLGIIFLAAFHFTIFCILNRRKKPGKIAEDMISNPNKYDSEFSFLKNLPLDSIVRLVFRHYFEYMIGNEECSDEVRTSDEHKQCMLIRNGKHYVFEEGNPQRLLLCDALLAQNELRSITEEILANPELPPEVEYRCDDFGNDGIVISIWQNLNIDYSSDNPGEAIETAIERSRKLQLDLTRRFNNLKLKNVK